jgi:hypothetical protein
MDLNDDDVEMQNLLPPLVEDEDVFAPPLPPPPPPPPPPPLPMWGLGILNDDLCAEIMAVLQGPERDTKISTLRRMNMSILRHENNLTFNRRVTREMGLTETGELVGMKRKGGGQAGRKKKKTEGEENWSAGESGESDSGAEDDEEEEGERSPVKTRGQKAVSDASSAVGVRSAKWAEMGKKGLMEVKGGENWVGLVDDWWVLEESWGFASLVIVFGGHTGINRSNKYLSRPSRILLQIVPRRLVPGSKTPGRVFRRSGRPRRWIGSGGNGGQALTPNGG